MKGMPKLHRRWGRWAILFYPTRVTKYNIVFNHPVELLEERGRGRERERAGSRADKNT